MQRNPVIHQPIEFKTISTPAAKQSRELEAADRLLTVSGSQLKLFDVRRPIVPSFFQLLIAPDKSWEPNTLITYSFQIPVGDANASEMLRYQTSFVDNQVALSPLPEFARTITRQQLAWWQEATTLRIVETDSHPMFYFFGFKPPGKSNTAGFSMVGTDILKHNVYEASIGISVNLLIADQSAELHALATTTITHEIGHGIVGFKHPFDSPYATTNPMYNTTSYTIMAYNQPMIGNKYKISITPMPLDLDTAHYLYGRNWQTRRGNTVYQLSDFTPYDHPTLASLPWDAGGIDTLSASNSDSPVIMDIRPYGSSRTSKGLVRTPNIEIENVVGGSGKTIIYLNEWHNQVDISKSKLTKLYVDPLACGYDSIVGFDPKRDSIHVISPQTTEPVWQLLPHPTMQNTTLVKFNHGHALELIGVSPEQFNNQTITIDSSKVDAARALRARKQEVDAALVSGFNLLNYQLAVDFLNAFGAGAGLTFIDTLTEEALTYYGVHQDNIELTRKLMHALYVIMSGTIMTNAIGVMASYFLPAFGFSQNTSLAMASSITFASQIVSNLTPAGLARTAINYAGAYTGSYLTLWARDKIKQTFSSQPPESKHFHPAK